MPVYVLREGASNVFKIGRIRGDVEEVLRNLHQGSCGSLSLYEVIVTDQEDVCETFLRRRLAAKRIRRGGDEPFFDTDPLEMRNAVSAFRQMSEDIETTRSVIEKLSKEQSSDRLLEPCQEDERLVRRLINNKAELAFLSFEREVLENRLKQRIGTSAGLRGLATWKTQVTRRFDQKLFKSSDPEGYERTLERFHCVDTAAWRRSLPDEYRAVQTTYFTPSITRIFKIQEQG